MHGLHESVLAFLGLLVSIFALLALAVRSIREDLLRIFSDFRDIRQGVGWHDGSPHPAFDPLHQLFPKPSTALVTHRSNCAHAFGFYIDGSVPRPQQLGAIKFGCVNCGLELKTIQELFEQRQGGSSCKTHLR